MSWVDRLERPIEKCLNEFMRQLYYVADDVRREAEQRERYRQNAEAESLKRYEAEQRQRRQDALVKDARERIANLAFAAELRELVTRVEAALAETGAPAQEGSDEAQWIAWARRVSAHVERSSLTTVAQAWRPKSPW